MIRPTDAEDVAINAAALSDQDNQPLSADQLAQFKRKPGRPAGSSKEQVTLRLDAEVLETFRATGSGWQTRINDVLKDWAKHH
ncbi:MAG: BrnA antitoxin family protein [Azonexus sp.]|nr:BrnA antitoxin family protein [Azonexus sp.]